MPLERRRGIADALRQRIRRGLQTGALHEGDKLPPTREIAADLRADPRVVSRAYAALADEGLVEIRARVGVFIARSPRSDARRGMLPESWLVEMLAGALERGVAAPGLPKALEAAVGQRKVNVTVVAEMRDQIDGLVRELREDYGFDARGVLLDALAPGDRLPRAIERAHGILTTPASNERIQRLAKRLRKPCVLACVRPDLLSPEWRQLMRRDVYVIIADAPFAKIVRDFVRNADGSANVRILVAGRDDLESVPADAPTYVTESARQLLGRTRLPGRLIAPTRLLGEECVRELFALLVRRNQGPPVKEQ